MTYSSKDKWIDRGLSEVYWFQEGPGVRNWQFTSSGIKLLNVANITKFGTIDLDKTERCLSKEEVEKKYKHFLVDVGDLVIASSGISFDSDGLLRTRGAFAQKEHLPLCMNTSTIRFKAKEGVSDLNFLKFWLDSYEFREQITRLVTGSAQQNFGPSHLKSIQIKLPPLAEQRWIVAIAQKADRLRRTRRYALQLSDTYLQSVFLEMFGDPASNPKGWDVIELNDVCAKVTDGTHHMPPTIEQGVPILRVLNIKDDFIDTSELKFISQEDYEKIVKRTPLEKGDILLTCLGTVGNAVIFNLSSKFTMVRNIALLKPNYSLICSEFLLYLLRTEYLQSQIQSRTRQSTQGALYISEIQQLKVILPDLKKQSKFAQIVQKFERLRTQQREAARQAEHLFQTLLHRAFRGELTPQHANDEPASVLLEEIGAEQAQAEAEAKAATQAMGNAAEYLGTKAKQQDTEPIQLKLPGLE